jgi:uncharacterized SAM-binding protein YcdF (DUF218 family)
MRQIMFYSEPGGSNVRPNLSEEVALFIASKLGWALLQPSNVLLLLLILGSALLIAGRRSAGKWLVTGSTAALTIIGVLPAGAWLLLPLENRFPANPPLPSAVDGIIVLGGGIDIEVSAVRDQLAMDEAAERLVMFVTLGRRYPQARLAFSGGSGELFGSETSEAAVVKQALRGLGLDPERVVFEDRSRNTFENARYSKHLLKPKPDECWLLITSAYHMPRAVGVFQGIGWMSCRTRSTTGQPAHERSSGGSMWQTGCRSSTLPCTAGWGCWPTM